MKIPIIICVAVFVLILFVAWYVWKNFLKQANQSLGVMRLLFIEARGYNLDMRQIQALADSMWNDNKYKENPCLGVMDSLSDFLHQDVEENSRLAMSALILNNLIKFGRCQPTDLITVICNQQSFDRVKLIGRLLAMANPIICKMCIAFIANSLQNPQLAEAVKNRVAIDLLL